MFTKLSRKQESVTDGQTSRYYYILSTLSRGDNNQELWGQQKVWITQLVTEDFLPIFIIEAFNKYWFNLRHLSITIFF
jgi:hypothetical protein